MHRVRVLAAVLALVFLLPPAQSFAQSQVFFSDPLTGPSSPNLSIPFNKFGYTPAGLLRVSDDGSGVDRPIVKTVSGGYLTETAFTAEITVNVGANDIAYFGLGQGTTNPAYYNEPSNAFVFRIHNWYGYTGIQADAESGLTANPFLASPYASDSYTGSSTTFRIVRNGDSLTLSVPSSGASRTYSVSQYAGLMGLTAANTFLFFGNTNATGTVFSNLSVTRPLPTTSAQCKDGGWRSFGVFANQGDCVSFVATKGKNPPGN